MRTNLRVITVILFGAISAHAGDWGPAKGVKDLVGNWEAISFPGTYSRLLISTDGPSYLLQADSDLPPHVWKAEFRTFKDPDRDFIVEFVPTSNDKNILAFTMKGDLVMGSFIHLYDKLYSERASKHPPLFVFMHSNTSRKSSISVDNWIEMNIKTER